MQLNRKCQVKTELLKYIEAGVNTRARAFSNLDLDLFIQDNFKKELTAAEKR